MDAAETFHVAAPAATSLAALAADASIEVTPKAARTDELRRLVRPGSDVFLTHLPGDTIHTRANATAAIAAAGMTPVPHVAAREAVDETALAQDVAALLDAGAGGFMLIGGGGAQKGPFFDALAVLQTGVLQRAGVMQIGLAGHPEGHPQVSDTGLLEALKAKLAIAQSFAKDVTIVSQFVFDPLPLLAWVEALRSQGVGAKVRVGLSGPASPATLLSYALRCGIGPSLKALQSKPSLTSYMTRRWRPDALAEAVAQAAVADPALGIDGLHIFPFGGLKAAGEWLRDVGADAALPHGAS
ncbi:MAG: methylenetetrahydrofolate reductase [Pseudomonadota bacterium]